MVVPNQALAEVRHEEPRLTEGHQRTLQAMDAFFGGYMALMLVLAAVAALMHKVTWREGLPLLIFLLANVVISVISVRVRSAYGLEIGRAIVGGIIAPGAYLLATGPLAPWWPGFLIMCLGGSIILGLITQRPFWGRLLVVYYVGLYLAATAIFVKQPNWFQVIIAAGVVAMVGLMFAQIMSLLGETLKKERDRTIELRIARDALFAEVEVAQEIQTLLLPGQPALPGCTVAGRMVPATEVGGDYYDVIGSPTGRNFLAIGDVSGHGLTSGLTMMMARSSLIGALGADPKASLVDIYRSLNRGVRSNLERMSVQMYMTFALLETLGQGRFEVVGRHLPVLIWRKATGAIEEVEPEGVWLGLFDEIEPDLLPTVKLQVERGDVLVLYTDGVLERPSEKSAADMFGLERLKTAIRESAPNGAQAVVDKVFAALDWFSSLREDDVTLLVVEYTGR